MADASGGPPGALARSRLTALERFSTRIVLLSPPRTGSTLLARLLWQLPELTHHCHEPFEAAHWGRAGFDSAVDSLCRPMGLVTGERVAAESLGPGAGLLIKEMAFQVGSRDVSLLADLATSPVIVVIRDPRLSTTSRLRVVMEISGTGTFAPHESGWPALMEHLRLFRTSAVPYVLVDSDLLRADPRSVLPALASAIGTSPWPADPSWEARPGLQLCSPEVSALMGARKAADDPFYRRVLASTGIQPVDRVDWQQEEQRIARAGLSEHVADWMKSYRQLLDDDRLLAGPR